MTKVTMNMYPRVLFTSEGKMEQDTDRRIGAASAAQGVSVSGWGEEHLDYPGQAVASAKAENETKFHS